MVRHPIQRLTDRHYELLREAFPDREEVPDDLRAFEVEILDEYTETEKQILKPPVTNCPRSDRVLVPQRLMTPKQAGANLAESQYPWRVRRVSNGPCVGRGNLSWVDAQSFEVGKWRLIGNQTSSENHDPELWQVR